MAALSLAGVGVHLDGRGVVDGVTLDVAKGALVALVGPNGAGKTTLLRAVAGILPHVGRVLVAGRDAATLTPAMRARAVAYLPQQRDIAWRLSARDVVALGRLPHRPAGRGPSEADRAAVERALRDVDAATLADRPATRLSGGERARVLLARALAQEAPLLLVDEPTAALDPFHQLHVMALLRARADEGASVVAVLHDLASAARFAHSVVLMDRGRVVASGPPATVLTVDHLARTYRVHPLAGRHEGERWILPWRRL
ncbi:MAG: ABC transporter ATP-binding protein [Alphaproteobacteria bacterium]